MEIKNKKNNNNRYMSGGKRYKGKKGDQREGRRVDQREEEEVLEDILLSSFSNSRLETGGN